MAFPPERFPMGERLSKFLPVFVVILVPLLLILANTIWNVNILITIAALVWLGFGLVFLAPSRASA